MAKINKRVKGGRTHQVGPTIFTTKLFRYAEDDHSIRYEAWRIRSDGWVQRRVIRSTDVDPVTGETIRVVEPRGSKFTNVARIQHGPNINVEFLKQHLRHDGYTLVKERH